MRALWLATAFVTAGLAVHAESGPVFRIDFSNPGLNPPQWTLEFRPDGTGHFHSVRGNVAAGEDEKLIEAPTIDKDVQVSAKFADHVFQVAQHHKYFSSACESHLKVAFQGLKKLSYHRAQWRRVVRIQLFPRYGDPGAGGFAGGGGHHHHRGSAAGNAFAA